jgi:2-desacetyl-2-hydroxyethyl bacteriochlorophyllide A dehydrogenase
VITGGVYPRRRQGKLSADDARDDDRREMTTAARSLWFVGPRGVEITTDEVPPLADGQVLVRTTFSGISSGTELLAYRGELDPELSVDETIGALGGTFRFPFRYGYSCVGVVEESRSALDPGTPVFAFHPHQDRFVADAERVLRLGSVSPREATPFPLVDTTLQSALDARPVRDETGVVFGLGVVGLLTALMIRRSGGRVVAVEPRAWRRDAAAGLDIVAVAPEQLQDRLNADGPAPLVPLVIEASGNPQVLRSALPLLAHEGTVLVASWYGTKEVTLPLGQEFHRRRLTIRSTQVSTIPARLSDRWDAERRRRAVVALLDELPLAGLATHTFPFAAAAAGFATIDAGASGLIHAAFGYE